MIRRVLSSYLKPFIIILRVVGYMSLPLRPWQDEKRSLDDISLVELRVRQEQLVRTSYCLWVAAVLYRINISCYYIPHAWTAQMIWPTDTCISHLFDKIIVTTIWFTHNPSVQCFWPFQDAKSVYASRMPHGHVHTCMYGIRRRIKGLSIVHSQGGYIISQTVL